MQKNIKIVFCFILLGMITACTPMVAQHGNMLQDFQIEEIQPGTDTRSDVLRIFGSPTTQSTFNNDVWYYIGQETEKRSILDHEVVDERIIAVTFDNEGIVSTVEHLDGDRQNIPYARTKTPTHGNDLTFMQQLLGNLGRFNGASSQKTTIP
tara:strand:+ start:34662 stop:35117 length:456 start_codon:yes stop_codon:yes gene_type:complete